MTTLHKTNRTLSLVALAAAFNLAISPAAANIPPPIETETHTDAETETPPPPPPPADEPIDSDPIVAEPIPTISVDRIVLAPVLLAEAAAEDLRVIELEHQLAALEMSIQMIIDWKCYGEGDPSQFHLETRVGPYAEILPHERPLVDAGRAALEGWVRQFQGYSDYDDLDGPGLFDCGGADGGVFFAAPNPKRIREIEEAIRIFRRTLEIARDLAAVMGRMLKTTAVWAWSKIFVAAGKKLALFADFDLRVKLSNMFEKLRSVAKAKGWSEAKQLSAEHKLVEGFLRTNSRALIKGALVALLLVGAGWAGKYAWDKWVMPPKSVKDANDALDEMRKLLKDMKTANKDEGDSLTKSVARLNEAAEAYRVIVKKKDDGGDVTEDIKEFEKKYKQELMFIGAVMKLADCQKSAKEDVDVMDKTAKTISDFFKDKPDADEISDDDLKALLDKVFDGATGDGPTKEEVEEAWKKLEKDIPDGDK